MTTTRRTARTGGTALVLAGLLVLGIVGWQLYGTTWVARRDQAHAVAAEHHAWDAGARTADGVVAVVRIPALGREFTVPARAGTDDDTIDSGLGIFGSSPAPGGTGNFALAGHRISHGEPFRDLPDLEPGDVVEVDTATTTYEYVLDTAGDDHRVSSVDTWVISPDPIHLRSDRLITLVTCAELFHTDDRLAVFGHLVHQQPRES